MHLVGSDAFALVDGAGVPAGRRHAVGSAQRAVCSQSRPRFLWPALTWDALAETACAACADALNPADEAYPADGVPAARAALVLWQPSPGLFEAPGVASS